MTPAQLARVEAMRSATMMHGLNDLDRAALTALLAERAKLREGIKGVVCESCHDALGYPHMNSPQQGPDVCTDCAAARAALGETA